MTGEELLRLKVSESDMAWEIHKRIARELNVVLQRLRVVLPDGRLLAELCRANPEATFKGIEAQLQGHKRRRLK